MHPNLYLRTFWRAEIRPQIFVAMSFDADYRSRFDNVIKPAIEHFTYRGARMTAARVDLSRSGDSILTDIMDGIAHSVMVVADISTVGNDSKSSRRYRNGNVMYEVGLALACRQSAEVLLIRDDLDPFLFDVSTIPHKKLDFSDVDAARSHLIVELSERLREIELLNDARAQVAIGSLTGDERHVLAGFAQYAFGSHFWFTKEGFAAKAGVSRLLDKGLIRTAGMTHDGHAMFCWTQLGKTIADHIDKLVPVHDFSERLATASDARPTPETK